MNRDFRSLIPPSNFFGIEEWDLFRKLKLTEKQLLEISKFHWLEDILNDPCDFFPDKTVKETHFAFLGLKNLNGKLLTIFHIKEINLNHHQPSFKLYITDHWYNKEKWAISETVEFRWHLALKETIPNSESKTFEEQIRMLPPGYGVPTAAEEVLKNFLYWKKNGAYLNPGKLARVNSVALNEYRVSIGNPNGIDDPRDESIYVTEYRNDAGYPFIGIAASRLPPH